jgi:hypothetical protein
LLNAVTTSYADPIPWHDRCSRVAPVLSRALAALPLVALLAKVASAEPPREGTVHDGGEGASRARGWRAITGLRLEQWIAPVADHLRFDVRLTLPEMALGERFSIETFSWERLDVAEGRPERGEGGTVYHLLGARYRRDAGWYGLFVGAHAFSWSGHGRPLTPWLGVRFGDPQGASIAAEAHLLGVGPAGGELLSPLDDADITLSVDGPRIGSCRLAARGRMRDVRHPDRHQREQMMAAGIEFEWGRRRLFLGLGVQHQVRGQAIVDDVMPTADRMEGMPAPIESTAVLIHLDAETPLPRSLLGP